MHECNYLKSKDSIHTAAVSAAIASAKPNRVLSTHPPVIHPSERDLPRIYQTTLSQLRSDWCSGLKSYQHFINMADNDVCPICLSAPQTVTHLFSCSTIPTPLTKLDLWHQPVKVAELLKSNPTFNHLPPLDPPLPLPPPEPPP